MDSSWDVDMVENLREDVMQLDLLYHMFKIYQLEKRIAELIRSARPKPVVMLIS